jgi:hypothetical protein
VAQVGWARRGARRQYSFRLLRADECPVGLVEMVLGPRPGHPIGLTLAIERATRPGWYWDLGGDVNVDCRLAQVRSVTRSMLIRRRGEPEMALYGTVQVTVHGKPEARTSNTRANPVRSRRI